MPQYQKSLRLHAIALLFFAALAFLILHTIIFTNGTHTAGYDFFNYNWNFWWMRHALTTPGLNVYENNFVMFPVMSNYGYHALTAFWFPLWALIEPVVGTLTAVNVIIFIGCTLNGYMLFALLRSEGVSPGLALVAGAALQALPISRYFYYNTHLNLMDWFWIPTQILLWKQIVTAKTLQRALMWAAFMGVSLWGVMMTDLQFPIFVAFLLAPYVLWTLWKSPRRVQLIAAGIVAVSIGAALMWFAGPIPYILRWESAMIPSPVGERPNIPIERLFTMADEWWDWESPSLGGFVMVAVLSAVVISVVQRKNEPTSLKNSPRWLWFVFMLPPMILMLGPTLSIGDTQIPMPFRWMYDLTKGNFRMPWRLAPVFVIAAMLFTAKTWAMIHPMKTLTSFVPLSETDLKRNAARIFGLAGAFLGMVIAVRIYEAAPLQPLLTSYSFYERMGSEMGAEYDDYVVLEAPTGAGTGEVLLGNTQAIQFQFYGITHQHRMVNGFISRAPLDSFYYIVSDDPLLSWLGQRRQLEPELVEAELRERIFNDPIGYIVIHQDYIGRNTSTVQEIVGYFNSLPDLLCPYTVEGEAIVYRTAWHPDGCEDRTPRETDPNVYQIDIGTPKDEFFLGWGWHWQEEVSGLTLRWAGEYPQATVYLDLPAEHDYTLTIAAQAFWETRTVQVLVNDVEIGEPLEVSVGNLDWYTVEIPASLIGDGQHIEVTLAYDAVVVPSEVGQSADPRRLSIAVDWMRFTQND